MKLPTCCAFMLLYLTLSGRADVTIVQRVEGAGPVAEMTIKIKGEKVRLDATPQISTIIDGTTGEMINLMKDQKTAIRLSPEKLKAASEMINKFTEKEKKESAEQPKLRATGKKETINGYEAEEYVYEGPDMKATYWIAPGYPDGAAILKEMQTLKTDAWAPNLAKMPDYRDFPGLPIKTVISVGNNQITSVVTAIKRDAINDAEFSIPQGFREVKAPEIGHLLEGTTKKSPAGSSASP
jgi:hypothetical protein